VSKIVIIRLVLVAVLLAAASDLVGADVLPGLAADEAVAVVRQSCSGHGGPEPCYESLSAWEADYGGIDFGGSPQGDLVAADRVAVARVEGSWTQADTAPLTLDGWTTDAEHYIRIYTAGAARHDGTPGGGYRLVTTAGGPVSGYVPHFRVEGLEIQNQSTGHVVYVRPGTGIDGDIRLSQNLIHGNGTTTGGGIYIYDYDGAARIWNNVIYDVSELGYSAGIQLSRGTAYVYNNTIVDLIDGFGVRSDSSVTIAKNNLIAAPGDDYYGSFYPGSDFNASSDDTAPGFHSRRDQTFTFVNSGADNYHLASTDAGARDYGTDLSSDPYIPVTDDVDDDTRSGGWDIGADEATSGVDAVPPIRSDGAPGGTLPSYTTEVTLTLSTNEAATCRYALAPGVAYAAMTSTFSFTGSITHAHTVAGLVDEQTYTYHVRCQDTASNVNEDDYEISFYIFSSDVTPPVISNVQVVDVTPYSARVTWETDEGCTSQVEHGSTDAYGTLSPISATLVTSHSFTLLGLDAATTYHVRVRSQDVAYNETLSGDYAFTTAALDNLYYVDQNHPQASDANPGTIDEPWLTIQRAADVAQPGDTIVVYPGSYGRVTINDGGAPGEYVTFKGLNVPDQSLVDPDAIFDPQDPAPVPSNPTLNAVMRGFTIQPAHPITAPVSYVRLENFEITDISGAGYGGASAIYMRNTAHVQVVSNFIHDTNAEAHSVAIAGSTQDNVQNVVRGNTLYRAQGVGISIAGRGWLVEENELSHGLDVNTVTGAYNGSDTDAVRFFGSGHVIRNNDMHDYLLEEQLGEPHIDCFQTFAVHLESQFAHDILVEGNTCDNFGQMFMVEDNASGNYVHHITFRNNILRGARASAINGSCDHFTFVNNVVADSHYSAIGLVRSPYLTLVNNIFYNNGGGSQIIDEDSKVGSVWDYNVHYPDFSWPHKQPEFDRHGMFGVDPRFVDQATGDYHLWFDSPAVDAGLTLYGFNYDKAIFDRPQGASWDIGAYEFVPSLDLRGTPGNGVILLDWTANVSLSVASAWHIDYYTDTAASSVMVTDSLLYTARAYALTDLENGQWYTVTLGTIGVAPPLSDTVVVRLMDHFVYLPLVSRGD
jgi:hypothetical protein